MKRQKHSMKHKRVKHYNDPGHAHELTFSCFQNQPFLNTDLQCEWLLEAVEKARIGHRFHIWAWVFMPNHVHLLIYPTKPVYDIGRILWAIKVPVATRAVAYAKKNAPEYLESMMDIQPNGKCAYRFWQRGGGYDRNMKEPQSIKNAIEYIHNNPVRRKFVEKPEEWQWSSAGFYAGRENSLLRIDTKFIPS
ncbi:transposase [bacterium]|nr:transposase [bacterium]